MFPRIAGLATVFALIAAFLAAGRASPVGNALPVVSPNDNRIAAGTMRGDTLVLRLRVVMARWYPEASDGPYVDAPAFAEEGNAPQIPGPLIRVPEGTIIDVTVGNGLPDSTLWIHGLGTRPSESDDSVGLAPGASHRAVFRGGAPGTYFYSAREGSIDWNIREREQLAGAFVVDSAQARTDDRVFVINVWGEPLDSIAYRNAVAINGRSWPHTERIASTVGDSVRWRWINASIREHPMHLHGFYFRIDAKGTVGRDTLLAPDARRLRVTETMWPHQTMSIVWAPDRPGNWLYHCHLAFHVIPDTRLEPPARHDTHDGLSEDAGRHMAGLVMGLQVGAPAGWKDPSRIDPTRLRLLVQEGPKRGRALRAMGYVLQRGDVTPAADSIQIPGPVLVLERDRPTDITVVNRLNEATAVHWHGIELESYSDGVAGWSGDAMKVAPIIAPGDSFVARLTMPRAGTFIYHTHLSDLEQITSGLYGAIVVVEPGAPLDPRRDHVFTSGWDGDEEPPRVLINGDSLPGTLDVSLTDVQRLRFVNIGPAAIARFRLLRDTVPVPWRFVARDGAELPKAQRVVTAAPVWVDVGQTADVEFLPVARERLTLEAWSAGGVVRTWQVQVH